MPARFFCDCPLAPGASLVLPEPVAHHAQRVLRLAPGDRLVLFDGRGGEYPARIESMGRQVSARIEAHDATEREPALALTLAQVVPAGERMDWIVQKAVELGVARISPLMSSRSVVRLSGERAQKRRVHWQQVAIGACEQCGRNRIPELDSLAELPQWLARPAEPGELRLLLSPRSSTTLRELTPLPARVTVLVGPEGGFSEEELKAADWAGFRPVRLGPRVLRADTAGLAALAALLTLSGDF